MKRIYWHDGKCYDENGQFTTNCTWPELLAYIRRVGGPIEALKQAPPAR